MAIIAPEDKGKARLLVPNIDSEQLSAALRPWHRRLTLQQGLLWTGRGLITGLVLACLCFLVSRLLPWATAAYWAFGMGAACFFISCIAAIWFRPSLQQAARLVDSRLSLHDRLSTAWEMRSESAPLFDLQRRDALKQLAKHTPSTAISLRPRRVNLITCGVITAMLVLFILLPNPMTAVLQQQAAFQARIARQITAIAHIRTELAQQTSTTAQQRAQIDQILRDLQAKLQQATNETQAQQAIAEAQAKLNQLRNPQANNQAQARAAASASLQGSPNASLSAVGRALAASDSRRLAAALQNLASQVSDMTPAQRAQLAQQLEQAANQAQQDPKLSAALHQLARAIADNNASAIADASNAVQVAAAQGAASQAQANSIDQASQGLQQAANAIASATDGTTAQNQNQGQGQGQGQNQNRGQGQGQGNGRGQGQGNNTGSNAGQNEQVFVPGQIGTGSSTQSNDPNNSVVQSGSSVPYAQVIQQYAQLAHDAIDNSSISPDLKDLVHGYFNALEGQ